LPVQKQSRQKTTSDKLNYCKSLAQRLNLSENFSAFNIGQNKTELFL